jgi:transposase
LAAEVSQCLGVSQNSLYEWKKRFSGSNGLVEENRDTEIRRLKRKLARVTEERDIKKTKAYFARNAN